MKKKTLSILLMVAMMFSLISLPQAAAEGEAAVRPGGDHTFEFFQSDEITGGSKNVTVQEGMLVKVINESEYSNNLSAILNYKLESNKTYAYEVVGTLESYTSGTIHPYLATATEKDVIKTPLVNMYQTENGWYAPQNGDIKYYGKFTTGELNGADYLAFYIDDGTVGSEFKFDKVKIFEVRSGDQTFNFDNDYDVFRTVNANADTANGILALNNNTGAAAELSATLNYQLKSNTAYSVDIIFYVEGESTQDWIIPRIFTSNPFTGKTGTEVVSFKGFGAKPGSDTINYYKKNAPFTTGEISESENLLRFYMWVGESHTYTYKIKSIEIHDETEYPVNTGDYTFDFDVRKKDTVNVTNGYVSGGKLVTKDGKKPHDNLTAILNYKLESKKAYSFEIVGNVSGYSNKTWMQAFFTTASKTEADTKNGKLRNLYYADNMSGAFQPKNGALTFKGEFTTGELTEDKNYLALFLNDPTDAKFEFDTIKITPVEELKVLYPSDSTKFFIPYGYVKDSSGKYIEKEADGSFKNVPAGQNYTEFPIPTDVVTFGVSEKEDTPNTPQFGSYGVKAEGKTFGTLSVIGDWDGFSAYYVNNSGVTISKLMEAVLKYYNKNEQAMKDKGATHVILPYGEGKTVKIFKTEQTKKMWDNDKYIQYSLRVEGLAKDDQVAAVGYSVKDNITSLSSEIKTYPAAK